MFGALVIHPSSRDVDETRKEGLIAHEIILYSGTCSQSEFAYGAGMA